MAIPAGEFPPRGHIPPVQDLISRLQPHLTDRYLFERELGHGGMATVYLAKDVKHEREVAIKVLHPELSESIGAGRFEREIKLAAKLQHPHILGLYDSGQADGLLYYVMPFVKGESLRDRLEREGQLPIDDAIQLILEIADALGHAHSQGIVHRDIKPENVLLANGHALVADFGIARAAQEAGGSKLTQTGMAIGTPVYMSPEQAVGDAVGPTSDIYSLGCVLYELLAGEPPFTAKNSQALMARHAMEAVPSIRIVRNTVPEEVEDAIFAAMAKVPADRPKDAAHFAELLGMPLGSTMTRRAAIRQTASRRVPTGTQRMLQVPTPWWKKQWVTGAAVLVLAGGAFAAYQVFAGPRPSAALDPATLARAKRIAVLYFASSDTTLRDVADGLTESLINNLKTVPGLSVRPRESVRPYRNAEASTDSVARALDVGTVIEGSVQPTSGNRVNITAQLWDGAIRLGQAGVTVSRDSLFQAGDAVATMVAQQLQEKLGSEIQLRSTQAGTASQGAWTLFQRAEKVRKDAELIAATDTVPAHAAVVLTQADSLLAQATAQDPVWIDPILLRAEIALQRSRLERERPEIGKWLDSALAITAQAFAFEPTNARVLAQRGTLRFRKQRLNLDPDPVARAALLDAAQQDLETATLQDPSLASAWAMLSFVYYDKKDVSTAFAKAVRAYEADAFLANSDLILNRLFWGAHDTNQFSDANKWCAEGERRFPRDYRFVACHLWLQLTPDAQPDIREAWRLAARVDSLAPARERPFQSHLARMVVGGIIGRAAKALPQGTASKATLADSAKRVLDRALGDHGIDPTQELMGYKAIMLTQMGEYDAAIALLKTYVALNPAHSFQVGTNVHWWWTDLKNHPGFQGLMSRAR